MKSMLQIESRDCGATCLAMVSAYYGLKYPIQKFRDLTKTDRNGTNLYGIVDAAEQLGFDAESMVGSVDELLDSVKKGEVCLPFVAHIVNEEAMLHYIVVYKIKGDTLYVADPGKGKVKYSIGLFSKIWSGYIINLKPSECFIKGNFKKGTLRRFFEILKNQKCVLIAIIVASFAISAIGICGAYIFEIVIDGFSTANVMISHSDAAEAMQVSSNFISKVVLYITQNSSNLNLFFLIVILIYLLQTVIQFLRGYMIARLSKHIDLSVMFTYYEHLIDLPISQISTRQTGEYLSRFSDAYTIRNAVSGATLTLLLDTLMTIAGAAMLFSQSKKLFIIALIMVVLYAIVVTVYRKPIKRINQKVMNDNAKVQSYLKESVDGIATIKAANSQKSIKLRFSNLFNSFIKNFFKSNLIDFSQDSTTGFIELAGTVIIIWIGVILANKGELSMGSLITFYALLAYFTQPIKNLIELQPMLQIAIVAAERLEDILSAEKETINDSTEIEDRLLDRCIEFKKVDFRYGNRELTLQNVNLKINKGERIAIVGESGSGKTTIARLLLRFYEAESGVISVDGRSIKEIDLSVIRKKIAYVDQNTFLFSDTIKNNLRISCPDATDEDIYEACRLSGADSFICSLPFKYDTYLDENGYSLSGGQRQRLSIARALLKKPEIVIFDEATSNLDTITENCINNTICDLNEKITFVIIAHRLSTIKSCNRIYVLEKGHVAETGTFEELSAKKDGIFCSFLC